VVAKWDAGVAKAKMLLGQTAKAQEATFWSAFRHLLPGGTRPPPQVWVRSADDPHRLNLPNHPSREEFSSKPLAGRAPRALCDCLSPVATDKHAELLCCRDLSQPCLLSCHSEWLGSHEHIIVST
jgi:hypothetical protein